MSSRSTHFLVSVVYGTFTPASRGLALRYQYLGYFSYLVASGPGVSGVVWARVSWERVARPHPNATSVAQKYK